MALFALLAVLGPLTPARADTALKPVLTRLAHASFNEKQAAVSALEKAESPRRVVVLRALMKGDLAYRKSDRRVVITRELSDGFRLIAADTGKALGKVGMRDVHRIAINNSIRLELRNTIARLSLADPDPDVRLAAVKDMLNHMTPQTARALRARQSKETNSAVSTAIATALALTDSHSSDASVRLRAVKTLAGSLTSAAHNRLAQLVQTGSEGKPGEPDPKVRAAAAAALKSIQDKRDFYSLLQTGFFGLSLGSVLLLAGIGLAITFGVMGVINMAHGEMMMLGAYTTYVVQLAMPGHIGSSLFVAIPAAFLVSGVVGILIERTVIRFLYGRPLETLLATFGISLILQQSVRSIFSPLNRTVKSPSWMSGSLDINSVLSLTYNRLYIVVFALIAFAALLLVLKKTSLGLKVRAVSQNRAMAKAMGVRTEWVDALTFGLGSGVAGIAGVALSQLTNVGPNLGQSYIIDSFMVVVFGGVGNLWGTLVSALTLGVADKFLEPWSGAVLAKVVVLVLLILFIQKRPRGLFPQKGRMAEG
ncbi:MAG TPA: urea ABC transporter permease subunit UrtB [Gammaproteobacteria bacterium]|nr:urea ABC transporter permease subunit UrtB [Gammaproteobacteria bacterium]